MKSHKKITIQFVLDQWVKYSDESADLLEIESYKIEWGELQNKKNLPRVRRARRRFLQKLQRKSTQWLAEAQQIPSPTKGGLRNCYFATSGKLLSDRLRLWWPFKEVN